MSLQGSTWPGLIGMVLLILSLSNCLSRSRNMALPNLCELQSKFLKGGCITDYIGEHCRGY